MFKACLKWEGSLKFQEDMFDSLQYIGFWKTTLILNVTSLDNHRQLLLGATLE